MIEDTPEYISRKENDSISQVCLYLHYGMNELKSAHKVDDDLKKKFIQRAHEYLKCALAEMEKCTTI